MTLLNQLRDKADRTYGEPGMIPSWAIQVQRHAFVKGACYAAAHFHGIAVGDYSAFQVSGPTPTYEEAKGAIEVTASATGYGRPGTELERKAYKAGAKWVLETFKSEPTISLLRINSGADGWTVMRDSTVLFTFNPKITMAEALDILTKLRS